MARSKAVRAFDLPNGVNLSPTDSTNDHSESRCRVSSEIHASSSDTSTFQRLSFWRLYVVVCVVSWQWSSCCYVEELWSSLMPVKAEWVSVHILFLWWQDLHHVNFIRNKLVACSLLFFPRWIPVGTGYGDVPTDCISLLESRHENP